MASYSKVAEKFKDKGYSDVEILFTLPFCQIFDPSMWQLMYSSREELYERFQRQQLKPFNKKLEALDIWIDYQKHK